MKYIDETGTVREFDINTFKFDEKTESLRKLALEKFGNLEVFEDYALDADIGRDGEFVTAKEINDYIASCDTLRAYCTMEWKDWKKVTRAGTNKKFDVAAISYLIPFFDTYSKTEIKSVFECSREFDSMEKALSATDCKTMSEFSFLVWDYCVHENGKVTAYFHTNPYFFKNIPNN